MRQDYRLQIAELQEQVAALKAENRDLQKRLSECEANLDNWKP